MTLLRYLRPTALALVGAATAVAAPLNILLIMTDQQTADALSFRMGREYIHTPALDRLAARGTYFSRAYAPNPLCMPARNSILTGRYPHETGITDNTAMYDRRRLDPTEFVTLGTRFQRAGYRTGYFGKWHLAYDTAAPETHGFEALDVQQLDALTTTHAGEFLAAGDGRPFLLVASFLNPHNVAELSRGQPLSNGPIGDPPVLEELPPVPMNLGAPVGELDTMEKVRRGYLANRRLFPVGHFSPSMWRALRWGYYRLVEKVDAEIGRVLDALEAAGHRDDTIIVFLSDHGECAGAHGLMQKTVFYEESVRVPVIVSVPGGVGGRESDAFVNIGVDLVPTLLDYAGVAGAEELPGRSLRAVVEGEVPGDWRDAVIIGNHMSQGDVIEEGFVPITEGRMVRTVRYKYCVYEYGETRESLVDLMDDPGEMVDLARDPAYRAVLVAHRERLRGFGERQGDALVTRLLANDGAANPFPPVTKPRRPTTPVEGTTGFNLKIKEPAAVTTAAVVFTPSFVVQSTPVRPEPFAATPLQINPPSFRWPAKNDPAAVHRVELARTPDFAEAVSVVVRELFYRPEAPLAEGRWYWRVRREEPTRGAWSATENFVIGAELPRWDVGTWERWLEQVPTTHPRVYVRAAELAEFRARAATLGAELEPWIERAKAALAKPFELAEWEAQVPPDADVFDQKSAARKKLVWAAKGAARAATVPAAEGAWLWLATGDPWWVERVKTRALLAASFPADGLISDRNTGHDLGNVDFGNATIVHDLGVIYDLMFDEFTVEERARLRAAIMARAAPMFTKMRRAPLELMRAHAWQHGYLDAMVGALAVMREEPEARAWVELGLKSFVALYPWFGGADGGSQEGPRYYHGPGMIPSLNTLDVFRSAFGLRLEEGNPWFRQNPYFLIYSFPPGSLQTQLGDANPGVFTAGDNTRYPEGKARLAARRMAEVHGNGHLAAYAAAVPKDDAGYTVSEVLRWAAPRLPEPVELATLPAARVFWDVGTVFAHSRLAEPEENVRMIFHATPYGGQGHAHADQNSFHVIAYNEHLLLDAGYYTPTGDPHRENYYVRTMAHNTLLVDGTGQQWGGTTGHARVAHFELNEDFGYWVGEAATAYHEAPLERFDRHVVWLRGETTQTYVIIDDVVAAGGVARRYDWLLHAPQEMAVDAAARRVVATGERGQATVTFVTPQALELTQTSGFPVPAIYWRQGKNFELPDQWHLTTAAEPAVRLRFVTVIQVDRRGVAVPTPEAREGGVAVDGWRVELAAGARRVVVTREQEGGAR